MYVTLGKRVFCSNLQWTADGVLRLLLPLCSTARLEPATSDWPVPQEAYEEMRLCHEQKQPFRRVVPIHSSRMARWLCLPPGVPQWHEVSVSTLHRLFFDCLGFAKHGW